MIDKEWANEFANEWIESWNARDLERILSHYTDDFEMSSPFIVERMNEPSGTLKGKDKVRAYWKIGLEQTPPLKFELLNVFVGVQSVTLLYKNQKNALVAEVLTFNDKGKAVKGNAHYFKQ
jgi:ketosteroid isomerase-like protein